MGSSASSSSCCPLLSRIDIARPMPWSGLWMPQRAQPSVLSLPFLPSHHPSPTPSSRPHGCYLSESPFLLPAQVYKDISHGGVFEDGCLERNHVFPSIHDAVLFAQANAREVAPGCDFHGVRSLHVGNPRPWGTEMAGRGA